jgi:hypothetical protein
MSRFDTRPGGVYRSVSVEAMPAVDDETPELLEADWATTLSDSLKTIANEVSHSTLWGLFSIALIATVMALFMLLKVHEWQHFAALTIAIAFLTMTACTGGYLLSIKTGGEKR